VAAVVGAVVGTVVAGCVVVVVDSTTVVVSSTDVVPTEAKAALSYQHSCQLLKDKQFMSQAYCKIRSRPL